MKRLFIFLLMLISTASIAGTRYTFSQTNGEQIINGNGGSGNPALIHGDTLDIPSNANFVDLGVINVHGIIGDSIVIRFLSGAKVGTGAIGAWQNTSYVKVIGYTARNATSAGVIMLQVGCHSIRFTQCSFINAGAVSNYSPQPAFIVDDQYGSTMYFTGSKAQTFYDIRIDNGEFNGYKNSDILRFGTDSSRSICTDIEIDHNIFKNFTQDQNIAIIGLNLNGFNYKVHDNIFDSLAYDAGACRCTHNAWIVGYCNGSFYNNKFGHQYGSPLRMVPLKWTGLPGYTQSLNIYNNIYFWPLSYALAEISPNNGYLRLREGLGNISFTTATVTFNTVYHSSRASFNGDYDGMIVEWYSDNPSTAASLGVANYSATVYVHNNTNIAPEQDRTYDVNGRGYIVYFAQGFTGLTVDTGGNKVFQTLAQSGITDTINWVPLITSPLYNSADNSSTFSPSFDYYGSSRPQSSTKDVGAVERISSVNTPPVSNAGTNQLINLPTSSTTLDGSASYDPDGSIATYAWVKTSGPSSGTITNPNSVTTGVTGLVSGVYNFTLTVSDNNGATNSSSVVVTVNIVPTPAISSTTDTLIVLNTSSVTLTSTGSNDPDGSISSYSWTKVLGTGSTIVSPTGSTTLITGLTVGIYIYQLTVTDNRGATASKTLRITVLPVGTYYFNERGTLLYDNTSFIRVLYGVKAAKNTKGQYLGYVDYVNNAYINPSNIYTSFIITIK